MGMRNGHIIDHAEAGDNPEKGRTIPLTDGRRAVLRNEVDPRDGAVYLFGMSDQQLLRTYIVNRTSDGFRLVPESDPAAIVPGLMLLFQVVDGLDRESASAQRSQ